VYVYKTVDIVNKIREQKSVRVTFRPLLADTSMIHKLMYQVRTRSSSSSDTLIQCGSAIHSREHFEVRETRFCLSQNARDGESGARANHKRPDHL
jgi:hypothetical protein